MDIIKLHEPNEIKKDPDKSQAIASEFLEWLTPEIKDHRKHAKQFRCEETAAITIGLEDSKRKFKQILAEHGVEVE